jgi:hypothetical protein
MHRRKEVASPCTQGVYHLAEEQTHQQKKTPQHKGLSPQQPPWHRRTLMVGFPQIREGRFLSLRCVLCRRTPCRTRRRNACKRLWAGASGCHEVLKGFVTQHTPILHWMCLLSQRPPLSWYETRTYNPPCFQTSEQWLKDNFRTYALPSVHARSRDHGR